MTTRPWQPIAPLFTEPGHDFSTDDRLLEQWRETRAGRTPDELGAANGFDRRLHRSWAIETGVIEDLYTLDPATTETLVNHGFSLQFVPRESTNLAPGNCS